MYSRLVVNYYNFSYENIFYIITTAFYYIVIHYPMGLHLGAHRTSYKMLKNSLTNTYNLPLDYSVLWTIYEMFI